MVTKIHRVDLEKPSIHVSYHGVNHSAIEFGVGYFIHGLFSLPHAGDWKASRSYAIAARVELGDTTMYAVEASIWGSGIIGTGLSVGYYGNSSTNSFYIRPEVGLGEIPLGFAYIRPTIGWNIRFLNNGAPALNSPDLQMRVTIPLGASSNPE